MGHRAAGAGGDHVAAGAGLSGVAGELMLRHAACFREAVLPALTKEGIEIRRWGELPAPNARACIGSFVTGSIQL